MTRKNDTTADDAADLTEGEDITETSLDLSPPETAGEGERFQAALATRRDSQRPAATRERGKNFGGPRLKLSVIGEIPGYHLYWENDDEGAIEQLLYSGFDFVEPSEVGMTRHIVSDADTANRVSRYVGVKSDGSPMRAYLMKCTDELWAEHRADRHAQADTWDASIRQGQVGPDSGRYRPKGADISLDTQFRKEH